MTQWPLEKPYEGYLKTTKLMFTYRAMSISFSTLNQMDIPVNLFLSGVKKLTEVTLCIVIAGFRLLNLALCYFSISLTKPIVSAVNDSGTVLY